MVKVLRGGCPRWSAAAAVLRRAATAAPGPRARPSLADAGIAVTATGVSLAGYHAATTWHSGPGVNLAIVLLIVAGGAALTFRRRYPVAVLGATLAAALVAEPVGHADTAWFPVIVALFAAVQARRRAAVIGSLVIGYLASVWPPWLIGSRGHTPVTVALALLCGLLALLSAAEVAQAAAQRRLATRRIREQELLRIAGEERMRIARDLHDVVAHHISVINVQANTALHLAARHPERATEALATINDVSRKALAELRSVLGVLRADGDGAPRAPAQGLADLDTLVSNMAGAGLEVRIETEGSRVPLPASTGLAAYRIIQEALTNSARHSGASRTSVRVRYRGSEVEIEVDDEGTAGSRPPQPAGTGPAGTGPAGTGSGIVGMSDRARALGGRLTAGPRPGGGFRVTAVLPVAGDTVAGGAATGGAATANTVSANTATGGGR
ncbi:MAG TPA: sensor histidine kinase [Trebonia sp.]|jgi:signal transduction histidine kinase